jgi:hypothetical protein
VAATCPANRPAVRRSAPGSARRRRFMAVFPPDHGDGWCKDRGRRSASDTRDLGTTAEDRGTSGRPPRPGVAAPATSASRAHSPARHP